MPAMRVLVRSAVAAAPLQTLVCAKPAAPAILARSLYSAYPARRQQTRAQSSAASASSSPAPATASLPPRWLSDVKRRIGKCIMFGLNGEQTLQAGGILSEVSRDWRELVAGSEGFLTGPDRRGFYRQEVVWGEMDSMVS